MTHEDVHTAAEAGVSMLPKNRATRRAHGQRGTAYLPVAHSKRRNGWGMRAETGPQRAQRRAAAAGLTIGAPVRARIGVGVGHRSAPLDAKWIPYGERTYAGPMGAPPLEFGERMSNYRLQQAVRTHHVGGTRWRPTPRQDRRLRHKANHAAAPFAKPKPRIVTAADMASAFPRLYLNDMVAAELPLTYAERLAAADTRGPAASAVIMDDPPREIVTNLATGERRTEPVAAPVSPQQFAKPERERSAINRNGFRVVDRRGEHR